MREFKEFAETITGFPPYDYQVKVAELLQQGKNVILTVPTGAGKTWASILPFLYMREKGNVDFPQKMIYSLPLRTLANSIYTDVSETLEKTEFENLSSIHTGEYKDDENFESDIVFSTIDQTLSNFLCFPLSLSKRQANVNAGALIGSYLVFDEFHLLDPKLSMATTLGTLKILDNLCRFCIMTATLSEDYITNLKTSLKNVEVVSIEDFKADKLKINSLKIPEGKEAKKFIHVQENTINSNTILSKHKKKTIVICNRVEKAQQIYNDIIANLSGIKKENVVCLHSRFFDSHRKQKETELKKLFGKNNDESAILISTQVIEAGMDISCENMHVEISPVNSFLQRAGRCARWEGQWGNIYVYDILENEEKELSETEAKNDEEKQQIRAINNKYLPYDASLCRTTLSHLKSTSSLDEKVAQNLVDSILAKKELLEYTSIKQVDFNKRKIQESWTTCEKNMYSQTIRDIQSIDVVIVDVSQINRANFKPYVYETIGLFKWSFYKWMKELFIQRTEDDDHFAFRAIDLSKEADIFSLDNDGYKLEALRNPQDIAQCYDTVFVDKSVLKYTSGSGLELGKGSFCSPFKSFDQKEKEEISYTKDTFFQHNMAIIGCYEQEFKPKLKFAFKELDKYWDEELDWDKLIKVMICLHDYGKLNSTWQKPMRELQKLKSEKDYLFTFSKNEVLAHSDFNAEIDSEIEKLSNAKKKPPHAGIGAYALINCFEDIFDVEDENIVNSVANAILKHHGVETSSTRDFEIKDNDYYAIKELLSKLGVGTELLQKGSKQELHIELSNEEWLIYFFLVRILRLSDRKATMDFKKYIK